MELYPSLATGSQWFGRKFETGRAQRAPPRVPRFSSLDSTNLIRAITPFLLSAVRADSKDGLLARPSRENCSACSTCSTENKRAKRNHRRHPLFPLAFVLFDRRSLYSLPWGNCSRERWSPAFPWICSWELIYLAFSSSSSFFLWGGFSGLRPIKGGTRMNRAIHWYYVIFLVRKLGRRSQNLSIWISLSNEFLSRFLFL